MECDHHWLDIASFKVESMLQLHKTLKELCFLGRMTKAVRLFCCKGLKVDHVTYAFLLQECIFRKQCRKRKRAHREIVMLRYECLKTKLLILYAKSGE